MTERGRIVSARTQRIREACIRGEDVGTIAEREAVTVKQVKQIYSLNLDRIRPCLREDSPVKFRLTREDVLGQKSSAGFGL